MDIIIYLANAANLVLLVNLDMNVFLVVAVSLGNIADLNNLVYLARIVYLMIFVSLVFYKSFMDPYLVMVVNLLVIVILGRILSSVISVK